MEIIVRIWDVFCDDPITFLGLTALGVIALSLGIKLKK